MKIYTIKDIAELADVGVSTVSRVLNNKPDVNEDTRQRVLSIIKECNYFQNNNAKHLKQRNTRNISVVVRGTNSIFLNGIIEKMQNYSKKYDYNFMTEYIDEKISELEIAKRLYAEKKIEGLIFLGGDAIDKKEELKNMGLPCVYSTASAEGIDLDFVSSVCVDDRKCAKKAVDYLFDNGHRKIAILGSDVCALNNVGLRYEGFLDSYKAHGIEFDRCNYIESTFSFHGSYNAAKNFLSKENDVTAIFAISDIMAVGAAKAAMDCGYDVPDDISVVGFDGISLTKYYNPTIATIRQPSDLIASTSIDLIIDIIEKRCARNVVLEAELVKGNSVKNINK